MTASTLPLQSNESVSSLTFQFVHLVILEFLKCHDLQDTLKMFIEEWEEKNLSNADDDAWYEFSHAIQLSSIVQENKTKNRSDTKSVIQVLLEHLFFERRKASHLKKANPSTVILSKPIAYSNSSSSIQRPKSAMPGVHISSTKVIKKKNVPSMVKCMDTCASSPSLSGKRGVVSKSQSPIASSLPHLPNISTEKIATAMAQNVKKRDSEEQLSNEKWLSEAQRFKMLRRDFQNVSCNLKEKSIFDRNITRFEKREKVESKWEEHLENAASVVMPQSNLYLQEEATKVIKMIRCKLCEYPFRKSNLLFRVSYKSVMDLRLSWCPNFVEPNPVLARPPRCYDEVRVCQFCQQLLKKVDSYRPSLSHKKKELQLQRRNEALAERRRIEKENNRLDPLDCDSLPSSSSEEGGCSSDEDDLEDSCDQYAHAFALRRKSNVPMLLKKKRIKKKQITNIHGRVGSELCYKSVDIASPKHLDRREWDVIS